MEPIRKLAFDRTRGDHERMLDLVAQIKAACAQPDAKSDCYGCQPTQRQMCRGNVKDLISEFIEATLKHDVIESLLMEAGVPKEHCLAHKQAHMLIAEQLKAIRVIFSDDGNCVVAIEGIDDVMNVLLAHYEEYDRPLEAYLLAAA
ncbi:MAG TPA: hypothetical protein VI279_03215 [Rhodocyclaceae bacterium]